VGTGWVPAVIIEVSHKDKDSKVLKVNIEGVNGEPRTMNYPDQTKIQACGEFVKDRDCKTSRRDINKKKPIKIRFMPPDYSEDGDYLPDNGKKYGEHGKAYGWSRDMGSNMKQYNEATKQELHSLVEFLPSPKSKACTKPGANCGTVNWSAKVGLGLFFVRLYVGDPLGKTKVDLMVNNKLVAKGEVGEDELKVFEAVVESNNEFIVIKENCQDKCDDGPSKLNAVEIMPYEEKPKKKKAETAEKQLCGHAFTGGRCEKGPDVTHCLFDDPSAEPANNCTGNLAIMPIPGTYQCKDQIGKYKCVKKSYDNDEECQKYCVNNCKKTQCIS